MGFLARLRRDDMLRNGTWMILATGVTGLVNILFRVVMGRMLTIEEFGEFNAIFALCFCFSMVLTRTIRTTTTDRISDNLGRGHLPLSVRDFRRLLRTMAIVGALFSVGFLLLSAPIKGFLRLDSVWLVIASIPFLALSWVLPVNLGVFQGFQRFLPLAVSTFVQDTLKLVFAALFVLMGLGAVGAMMGAGVGAFVAFVMSLLIIVVAYKGTMASQDRETAESARPVKEVALSSLRELTNGSGHVLLAVFSLAVLTNIDVLVVAHFYSGEQTGLYSAALTFGRIIYFLPVGFTMVMYPKMVEAHARGQDNSRTLAKAILYVGLPVLAIAVVLMAAPSLPIRLLLGSKYLGTEDLVALYGALMFIFTIGTILVNYFLAIRRHLPIYIFAAASILQIVAVWFVHPTLEAVIWIFIWFNLAYLLIASALLALDIYNRKGRPRAVARLATEPGYGSSAWPSPTQTARGEGLARTEEPAHGPPVKGVTSPPMTEVLG
jgi:O-antigen/teichoic acid export membrane protein